MTTSRQKAIGSAAERRVAELLHGRRVGMDGGPVDVIVDGYLDVQVKNVRTPPAPRAVAAMLAAMPKGDRMRAVVVIERAGSGRRGMRTITFDLDDWVEWHVEGER